MHLLEDYYYFSGTVINRSVDEGTETRRWHIHLNPTFSVYILPYSFTCSNFLCKMNVVDTLAAPCYNPGYSVKSILGAAVEGVGNKVPRNSWEKSFSYNQKFSGCNQCTGESSGSGGTERL